MEDYRESLCAIENIRELLLLAGGTMYKLRHSAGVGRKSLKILENYSQGKWTKKTLYDTPHHYTTLNNHHILFIPTPYSDFR